MRMVKCMSLIAHLFVEIMSGRFVCEQLKNHCFSKTTINQSIVFLNQYSMFSKKQKNSYLHSIGNMMIIDECINIVK
jgi:hypothetical protein